MAGALIDMVVSSPNPGHWSATPGNEIVYEKDGTLRRLTEMCVLYQFHLMEDECGELVPDYQCRAGRAELLRDEKDGAPSVRVSHERMIWALVVDGSVVGDRRAYDACHAFDGQAWFDGGPL